ncbi:hypothetical protein ACFL26_00845, partial [Patescibacteria group bacterium]
MNKKAIIYSAVTLLIVFAMFATPTLVLGDFKDLLKPLESVVTAPEEISLEMAFDNPNHLAFNIEKVLVDPEGIRLKKGRTQAEVISFEPFRVPDGMRIIDFSHAVDVPENTSVTYQVSNDSHHWYWHDGSKWTPVGDCSACSSAAGALADHLGELELTDGTLRIKAVLQSDSVQVPSLRHATLKLRGEAPLLPLEYGQDLQSLRAALATPPPPPDDCICDGKLTTLSLRYNDVGTAAAAIRVEQNRPEEDIFDELVLPGETFTFSGTAKWGALGTEVSIYVNEEFNARIHTSCSEPVEIGMDFGSFTVMYGESRNNGPLCHVSGNNPPVAVDDYAMTDMGVPVTIPIVAN